MKGTQKKPEKPKGTVIGREFIKRTLTFDRAFPVLYAVCYALIAIAIHVAFFPIGDDGVETDFYGDLVVGAQELWKGNFSVAHYPYKGPIYSFALVFIHLFGGDWYLDAVVLNALCAAMSLVVVYFLLLRIFNRRVACFAMVSVSLFMELFLAAHKASSDMLFFLFCYLAFSLLLDEKLSRYRLVCGALASALAFLTRYNGVFLPFSTLIVLLILNPGNRPLKHRISSYAVYLIVFIVACAPWFAANYFETGSMLSTRNLENIVREFYSGTNAARAPEGGFTSLGALLIHDPILLARHYFTNIPRRIWLDMRDALGLFPGFLVFVGFLRFLFVPPTRRQWAFFIYPFGLFLAGCFVFYLPRFSIPWVPAYFAIGYSVIFGSGAITRSRLGIAFERAIGKHMRWLNKDLIGDRKSGIDKAPIRTDKRLHKKGRGNRVRRDRLVFPRLTPGVIAAVLVIGSIFSFQVTCSVGGVKAYYEGRPLFIFDAAEFLKVHHSTTGGTDRPVIMARKPHIAYYTDFAYQTYPQVLNTSTDYLAFAIRNNVNYIVYSELERKYYTASELLTRLEAVPGVKKIYNKPDIIVYQLEDWINIREEAGKNALAVLLTRLKQAQDANQHDTVVNVSGEIVGLYAVNGEWAEVERYLLIRLRAAEQMSDPAIANRYVYSIRRSLAQAYRKLGEHEKGIALLMQDREFYESRGDKAQLANIHFQLSIHYKELGDKKNALDHFRASYEFYVSIGDMKNAKAIQGLIEALQTDR